MNNAQQSTTLLALIPAYNEGLHISRVVQAAQQYLPVLVVDDGSKDNTAEQAMAVGAEVLRQTPNQGKGAALLAGFRRALDKGCSALVMLDADGQHDPDEIPKFLEAYHSAHADLVIGHRDFRYMPPVRRTTNTIGTWMFSRAIGQHIPDNQSGYRLLSRRMIEAMLESKEGHFEFEVEMIVLCVQNGYRMDWVPIKTIYGDEKSHIQPLRHAYHFLRMVWQTSQAMKKHQKR